MAEKVIMPKQGLQMTEGTIMKWFISEGESIKEGEPLFEMETDKLTITIDSLYTGTLLKIIKDVGEVVPITETIAIIGEENEDISSLLSDDNSQCDVFEEKTNIEKDLAKKKETKKTDIVNICSDRIFITPRARKLAQESKLSIEEIKGTGPNGRIVEKDVKNFLEKAPKVTPIAKKMLKEYNISANQVNGSGVNGKILKSDIERSLSTSNENVKYNQRSERVIPLTGMRKTIADRMCQSLREMAQTNHKIKVDSTEIIRLRDTFKSKGIKLSYNDILTKLVSKALMEYPEMNSSLTDEGLVLKDYVNMGLAVAVDKGLIVPVIKDTDLLSLEDIGKASLELIEKTKTGQLTTEDYSGGTFTISSLGMFDLDEFTAIINPPEAGILAVGKIDYIPVVENRTDIVIKPMMVLTLSYDHRIVDGADAAKFLRRVKELVQNPYLAL